MNARRLLAGTLLLAVCTLAAYARAEITASERKKIVELMDILGAENISRQVAANFASQLAYSLKQSQPQIDDKAMQVVSDVTNEVFDARSGALLDKMIPLYDKHFTEAEIDELLAYYRSPIGRKLVETMPKLMAESMELAVDESKSAIVEIQDKVKAKLRADGLIKE